MMTPSILIGIVLGQDSVVESIGDPAVVLGAMGLILGLGLAFAARKLSVPKDPVVERINGILPGANCGGCGFPGCVQFAEAVARGDAPPNGCVAASAEINRQIAEVVGGEISESVKMVALVHCNGGHSAKDGFGYHGPVDCVSASMVMGGQKICSYGCLGFGDCVEVCPFDAIRMGENGVPVVDRDACTGCARCVEVCPKRIIELWPVNREVVVACSSLDKGGEARKACSVACIGCRKCEKACPVEAVKVDDNLAVIDPDRCINCGLCASECPTGAILDNAPARPRAYIDSSCIGCTLCTKVCPVDAISGELKERHSVDTEKCIGCGLCVSKCPKNSINLIGAKSYQQDREFRV
ncbi:MAG: RnfABCDGE type electron transport complex subunit B [Candidatus Fermentibacteraceae bacterium]|nr:RnfABCDGE type electron transport complex subunit B [Candidatus Fermentibacteraceae bacterium]MBN2609724.1 RnfABCDGE type electron transport complex subunit B [Candidatus Fermentibacteraceae bacterium]